MEWLVSLNGLDAFAAAFWKEAGAATVFLFHGELGAGKTTVIAALCRARRVHDAVSSPTFSLINEYTYTEHGVLKKLYHMDLYRLQGEEEAAQAGVEDCLYSGAICLVEWPEKAPGLFDAAAVHVVLEPVSATERRVRILSATALANRTGTVQI